MGVWGSYVVLPKSTAKPAWAMGVWGSYAVLPQVEAKPRYGVEGAEPITRSKRSLRMCAFVFIWREVLSFLFGW